MSKTYKVSRVAGWDGWCSPCQREDRPLVVTRGGPAGLLAWIAGIGDDDRNLLLTCRVCGEWQHVPAREEDDPEVVLEEEVDAEVRSAVAAIVQDARTAPAPLAAPLPAPVPVQPVTASAAASETSGDVLSLAEPVLSATVPPALVLSGAEAALELAEALAGVRVPEPRAEQAAAQEVAVEQPAAEVAAEVAVEQPAEPVATDTAEQPAAEVVEPRRSTARILTVPDPVRTPAFSTEAVAAAARVLSAARTDVPQPARRAAPAVQPAVAEVVPVSAAIELPAVLGLPAGSRQVVLAVAS